MDSSAIGAIRITEGYSLVEVAVPLVDHIITALKPAVIRGQRVEVRRDGPKGDRVSAICYLLSAIASSHWSSAI